MTNKNSNLTTTTQRKLSIFRLFILLTITIGIIYLSYQQFNNWWWNSKHVTNTKPWFASYVDVTATPTYKFETLGTTDTPNVVLSFIVSSPKNPCIPTWGTAYNINEAGDSLDLDRRIARLQQQGGKIAISFGGAINDELSINCTDETRLIQAYESVINHYQIDTIDLDLENEGLKNQNASQRRAKTIAKLQTKRRQSGQNLAVWITLPVAPQGLTQDGTQAISIMLQNGVDIAGINVMTMNYNQPNEKSKTMQQISKSALMETHRQLEILYRQAGIQLNSTSIWKKIGATPMIGQNDVINEVFTLEDAQALNQFAQQQGIGRISMWSANRDIPCGDNYVNLQIVSDSCSGLPEKKSSFSQVLSQGFNGDISQNSKILTTQDPNSITPIIDNPSTSPYQIWQETGAYIKDTKVVWHGNVYQAKWWTKGDIPDNPVLQSWETPWQIIGPVLPGEKPVQPPTLPEGTYPEWSGTEIYQAGDRIIFQTIPYQAKWWTQGDSPAAATSQADSSPWEPLTIPEINQILNQIRTNQISPTPNY